MNQSLLGALADTGEFEIELVTSCAGTDYSFSRVSTNISIHRVPVNNKNPHHSCNRELLTYSYRGFLKARQLHKADPFQLVFAWSSVPAGAMALLFKWLCGVEYFIRVMGPDIPGFEDRYRYLYPVLRPLIYKVWRNSRSVIVKCQYEKELILHQVPNLDLMVLPNGVDTSIFSPSLEKRASPKSILCVARLVQRKGIDVLIRAFSIALKGSPELCLKVVGTGDEEQSLKRLCNDLGIGASVEFIGSCPREEMPNIYRASDIFVLPSHNEGMSIAVLEAMAAGLPCVVTFNRGLDDLVTDQVTGLTFNDGDHLNLAKKIETLLCDSALRERLSSAARLRAQDLSLSAQVANFVTILRSINPRRVQ
ncbi:MAG: glycosyltransferase family 4 protein [Deltaproteobacteria bacterium]|nr:glycosyltransferase family 4 protein [Deltaproteobacteria bacterium]